MVTIRNIQFWNSTFLKISIENKFALIYENTTLKFKS